MGQGGWICPHEKNHFFRTWIFRRKIFTTPIFFPPTNFKHQKWNLHWGLTLFGASNGQRQASKNASWFKTQKPGPFRVKLQIPRKTYSNWENTCKMKKMTVFLTIGIFSYPITLLFSNDLIYRSPVSRTCFFWKNLWL